MNKNFFNLKKFYFYKYLNNKYWNYFLFIYHLVYIQKNIHLFLFLYIYHSYIYIHHIKQTINYKDIDSNHLIIRQTKKKSILKRYPRYLMWFNVTNIGFNRLELSVLVSVGEHCHLHRTKSDTSSSWITHKYVTKMVREARHLDVTVYSRLFTQDIFQYLLGIVPHGDVEMQPQDHPTLPSALLSSRFLSVSHTDQIRL